MAAAPDAVTWTRLGEAHLDAGKLDESPDALDKALALPNISSRKETWLDEKVPGPPDRPTLQRRRSCERRL
jgi:hypothetical protein